MGDHADDTVNIYDMRHGGPYDRGAADSYYRIARSPHYFEGSTYFSKKVIILTPAEVEAYNAGYNENEKSRAFKDWGQDEENYSYKREEEDED